MVRRRRGGNDEVMPSYYMSIIHYLRGELMERYEGNGYILYDSSICCMYRDGM